VAASRSTNPFIIPERQAPDGRKKKFDFKGFNLWVAELPTGNVGKTAMEIYGEIDRLNRLEISTIERFEALEVLQQPLHFVLESLASHYLNEPLPLSERERMIARTRADLMKRTVVAYKIVLEQMHEESFAGHLLHKHARIEALHRVVYYLGLLLLHYYQIYQEYPEHIWREINGIYNYAESEGLHKKEISSEDTQVIQQSSIVDLYKQSLLLSLAGPYRLLKGEVEKVYQALNRWARLAELVSIKETISSNTRFVVDLEADHPPCFFHSCSKAEIEKGWILKTDALESFLSEELVRIQGEQGQPGSMRPQDVPDAVSSELRAKLMLIWGIGVSRSDSRSAGSGEVLMACGIKHIYSLFGGKLMPASDKVSVETFTGEKKEGAKQLERDEYVLDSGPGFSTIVKRKSELGSEEEGQEPTQEAKDEFIEEVVLESQEKICQVVNRSAHGYFLAWSGSGDSRSRVGELVAINDNAPMNGKVNGWRLGVIRWLRAELPALLEFGVEMLEGVAEPVVVHRKRVDEGITDNWHGLLLKREEGVSTLITPPFYATNQDRISVEREGVEEHVALHQTLQCTDSFVQFHYDGQSGADIAFRDEMPETIEEVGKSASDEFEALFKDL
jgi:hypothetical protein